MAFWSGQTLAKRLAEEELIKPFNQANIDCAAYTLTMGEQYYVTPARIETEAKKGSIDQLAQGESFKIAPGQFAFLLTEETVRVPRTALAFISIRSTYKWKGLANISGFHVDPGWDGKLVFGVYNAGPSEIHITRGTSLFLIWYSDLDSEKDEGFYKKYDEGNQPRIAIDPNWVSQLSAHIYSPMTLTEDIRDLKEVVTSQRHFRTIVTWVISAILAAAAFTLGSYGFVARMLSQATATRIEALEHRLERIEQREQQLKFPESTPPAPKTGKQ